MSRVVRGVGALGAAGAGLLAYSLVEPKMFTLRRFTAPVLERGAAPISVLHLSDLHVGPKHRRKAEWVARLAQLQPDLVVNTGDTFTSVESTDLVLSALRAFDGIPRVFVPGNNDYFTPVLKSPHHYFVPGRRGPRRRPDLPWPQLAAAMTGIGWTDLTHVRTRLLVAGVPVALAGLDDPHLKYARYEKIAGPADPDAVVRIGVLHSPEPALLDRFAADGYDLALAGHTHGGQVRIPFGPAIVTNCGIDVHRARWLHRWDERMWFHVCAGLGTNPYTPVRFACRPEASLLTLVERP